MIPADRWAGLGPASIIRGDALNLPIPDSSVDLIVTSPPYFALRSYQDGGAHYGGQIGSEATPDEFVTSLLAATREMVRVLKPSGSIFVNLGDCYAGKAPGPQGATGQRADRRSANEPSKARGERGRRPAEQMTRTDAAWLAGVIDSDGSVSIHINQQPEGRAPSFVPWVRIGQMRPEVVQHAAEITGIGQVMKDTRGVWSWTASAQQARWVLERIHPWLLIKAKQAAAAIEVARHVADRNGRGSYRPLTPDDIAYRYALRNAVLAWNKGQDDPLEAPRPPHVTLPNYPRATPEKSLRGLPWRYALRCIDELGLILRAEILWSKPNGLPESVTDRVRRSHETWFHFTVSPRYFAAVDEIREPHVATSTGRDTSQWRPGPSGQNRGTETGRRHVDGGRVADFAVSPLGKLPGSVREVPTAPLRVPAELGVDHFAAFPPAWPAWIIRGWSPTGVCVECGEGRRPVRGYDGPHEMAPVRSLTFGERAEWARRFNEWCASVGVTAQDVNTATGTEMWCRWTTLGEQPSVPNPEQFARLVEKLPPLPEWFSEYVHKTELRPVRGGNYSDEGRKGPVGFRHKRPPTKAITGYACACPTPDAPTRPAVVLDPFGGTGTTAMAARALGRHGISVDLSADYCRLARWRVQDPDQLAAVRGVPRPGKPADEAQSSLLDMLGDAS